MPTSYHSDDNTRTRIQVHPAEPVSPLPPPLGAGRGGGTPPETKHAALTIYRILDATHPPDPSKRYVITGDDLASLDAALKLAAAGARVRLLSTQGALAWDAHPGFRALGREGLQRLGVTIGTVDERPDPAAIHLAGRLQDIQATPQHTPPQRPTTITDAWEAGAMATAVYAAAAWATSV